MTGFRVAILMAMCVCVSLESVSQSILRERRPLNYDRTHDVAFFGRGLSKRGDMPVRGYKSGKERGLPIDIFKDFPGLQRTVVDDISAGPDSNETTVAVMLDFGSKQYRNAILIYDAAGKLVRTINTAPYYTLALVADVGGEIFALSARTGTQADGIKVPYEILQVYSASGELKRQLVPSTSLRSGVFGLESDGVLNPIIEKQDELLFIYAPTAKQVMICDLQGKLLRNTNVSEMLKQLAGTTGVSEVNVRGLAFLNTDNVVLDLDGYAASKDKRSVAHKFSGIYTVDVLTTKYKSLTQDKDRKRLMLGGREKRLKFVRAQDDGLLLEEKPLP